MLYSMADTYPDTLVLQINTYDADNVLDDSVFIMHEYSRDVFIVRGNRVHSSGDRHKPCGESAVKFIPAHDYSFECRHIKPLAKLLFSMARDSKMSYNIANYKHLPRLSNDITHELLNSTKSCLNEVVGYNDMEGIRLHELIDMLKIIMHVRNDNC